jgi:hypothetical protein
MPRPPARFNSSEKGLNGITPVKPQAHAVDPSPAPNILGDKGNTFFAHRRGFRLQRKPTEARAPRRQAKNAFCYH